MRNTALCTPALSSFDLHSGIIEVGSLKGERKMDEKPLDQRAREAEQYAFDFDEKPKQLPTPPPPDFEQEQKICNRAGYCYCPKCNPR